MVSSRRRGNPELPEGGAELIKKPVRGLLRNGKGGIKKHGDGSLRTSDGKYAGTDGTNRSGKSGEDLIHQRLKNRGLKVDTRQQTVHIPVEIKGVTKSGPKKGPFTIPAGKDRRYDGAVQMPDGKWYGIETKSGGSPITPRQRAIDEWLNTPGNTMTTTDGKVLHGVKNFRV